MPNTLYYGDNLQVLREQFRDEIVDLVYLDPPFNSNASYNVLFRAPDGTRSKEQIQAFEDTWHWGEEAEHAYHEVLTGHGQEAAVILKAFRQFLGENDMMAYLTMMAQRLIELRRVLKATGSLYLHCDPTASHYLKILLDGIFGATCFRNEVVWQRTNSHNDAKTWARVSDRLLFYGKSDQMIWNTPRVPYSKQYIERKYTHSDEDGRLYMLDNITSPSPRPNMTYEWKGHQPPHNGWRYSRERMAELDAEGRIWYPDDTSKRPRLKRYLDEGAGAVRGDVWTDIYPLNSQAEERIGYPTQKPQALLERLIAASSNEGDVILDPFCGCGTAIEAAEALGRQWAGIDVTHIAIQIIEDRMRKSFPTLRIPVVGRPTTLDAARDLAERDKHEFQLWATWLAGGHPRGGGKKGADRGIDGDIYFRCGSQEHLHGVLSIKGGRNVGPTMVRDLAGTVSNEGAHLGVFITLTPPTAEMQKAANAAGIFRHGDFVLPRLQIVTVEQLLAGIKTVQLPAYDTVAAAEEGRREIRRGRKRRKPDPRQREIAYVFENREPAEVYEEAISPEIEPVLAQIPVFMAKSVRHQPNGMARARGGRKTTKRTA